jgi:hypothetical protein
MNNICNINYEAQRSPLILSSAQNKGRSNPSPSSQRLSVSIFPRRLGDLATFAQNVSRSSRRDPYRDGLLGTLKE